MRALPKSLGWSPPYVFLLMPSPAPAEEWSRAYINKLPDSAFVATETTRDGNTLRHLPHHDHTGTVDIPHLKSARARLKQVKWIDPSNETKARIHLEQHWREYRERMSKAPGGER